jgi:molecular chaperone DnaK
LAEKLYAQKTDAGAQAGGHGAQSEAGPKKDDDDVVDADYTEVK